MAASSTTAHHVLDVLLLFNESRPTLTAEEIGDLIDAPRSSTYRYIRTLRERGLLQNTADGGFTLGPRVLQLAQAARRRPDADTTLAIMRQLSRRTGETVVLTRLFEQTAVCIESVEGPQALRIRVERGQVQPLHATAAARVLLANLPEETWDHYLGEPLEPFTEQTITDPQALRAQLRQIRRQGYCVSDGELESGLRAVAVPVFDNHNDRLFALSVIGPAFRLSEQHLTEFRAWLQEAATALQEQFE